MLSGILRLVSSMTDNLSSNIFPWSFFPCKQTFLSISEGLMRPNVLLSTNEWIHISPLVTNSITSKQLTSPVKVMTHNTFNNKWIGFKTLTDQTNDIITAQNHSCSQVNVLSPPPTKKSGIFNFNLFHSSKQYRISLSLTPETGRRREMEAMGSKINGQTYYQVTKMLCCVVVGMPLSTCSFSYIFDVNDFKSRKASKNSFFSK